MIDFEWFSNQLQTKSQGVSKIMMEVQICFIEFTLSFLAPKPPHQRHSRATHMPTVPILRRGRGPDSKTVQNHPQDSGPYCFCGKTTTSTPNSSEKNLFYKKLRVWKTKKQIPDYRAQFLSAWCLLLQHLPDPSTKGDGP